MAEWRDRNRFYSESDAPAYRARGEGGRRPRPNRDGRNPDNVPRPNRDRVFAENVSRPIRDRVFADYIPRPNRDRGHADYIPRPNRDGGHADYIPRPNRDGRNPDYIPRPNRDGRNPDNVPRPNRDRVFAENVSRPNRDREYAEEFPGHNRDRRIAMPNPGRLYADDYIPRPNRDREYTGNAPIPNRDREYTDNAPRPNRDREYTGNAPRPNRDREYTENAPRPNRDREYTENAPRPNRDREYTGNAPRPNRDREYTGSAPRPNRDREYTENAPRPNRDREYTVNAPRPNRDRGYTENAPRHNRERRITENAPEAECDEYLMRCEELSRERDPSTLIDFMTETEDELDRIIDSQRLPIPDIRSLVWTLTHPHFTKVTPLTLHKINAILAKIPDTAFVTSKYNFYKFIERNFSDMTERISYQDLNTCVASLNKTVALLRTLMLKFQSEHPSLANCIVLLNEEIKSYDYGLGPHEKEAIVQLHALLTKVSCPREKTDTDQQVDLMDSEDEEKDYGDPFRSIPIYPSYHEIRVDSNVTLRQLIREGEYTDMETYLDIHFKLLREDMIYPLKIAIRNLLELDINYGTQLYTYDNVKLECISTHHQQGMIYRISFNPYGIQDREKYDWKQSTRLKFGALVCISQKNDKGYPTFETPLWAVVTQSDEKDIKSGVISVKFKNGFERHFKFDTDYFMIESREVYFEAYCHILSCLQAIDSQKMPFAPILLGHANDCDPPDYIDDQTMLDFGDLIEGDSERVKVLCDWPPPVRLNDSQYEALKLAFTKKVALIQGPPGTGKTLVGFEIAKILLRTRKRELNARHFDKFLDESICKHPIFTITQSNHALDQFLEMIMGVEDNIVRIGGRSESELVKTKTLFEIKKQSLDKNASKCPEKIKKLKREYWEIKRELEERTKLIEEFSKELKILTNTNKLSLNQLKRIASEQHYKSLLQDRPSSITEVDNIVELWLNCKAQKKENKPKNIPLKENPFAIIASLDLTVPDDAIIDDKYKTLERRIEYLDLKPKIVSRNKDIEPIQATAQISVRRKFALYDSEELEEWYDTEPDFEDLYLEPEYEARDEYLGEKDKETLFEAAKNFKEALETVELDTTIPDSILKATNVWELSQEDREILFKYWVELIINTTGLVMKSYAEQYLARTKDLEAISNGVDLYYLESAAVIGMTTTGAAKNSKLLSQLKPRVIIVEEAAEVLEAHILTSLCSSVEHLIMIGDHQQLRPSNAVFSLAKLYNLNLSLFERLVINGVQHVTLNCQHRMRPEISKVMKIIYPVLTDHDNVKEYPSVRGVTKNTFFISHDHLEDDLIQDTTSRSNTHEANMVVQLTLYLLKQGYEQSEITLLTFYNGQKHLLNRLLEEKVENHDIRVTSVDKFQGEENRIVILSVVRGNERDYIGHCAVDNRVCVAFSRAREGFFVIGNEQRLRIAGRNTASKLWNKILSCFKESNSIGTALPLCCPTHNHIVTLVSNIEDFEAIKHGGCGLKCEFILPCNHMCPHFCHPGSHDKVTCSVNCKNMLSCNHPCPGKCGVDCTTIICTVVLEINAPCGHPIRIACGLVGEDSLDYTCGYKCTSVLLCGHPCTGTCGMCSGDLHNSCPQKCPRALICGHPCGHKCHFPAECPACVQPCFRACVHSKCTLLCGDMCTSCHYEFDLKCQHYPISIEAREPSTHPLCEDKCSLKLTCGHPCLGLCAEACPPICRICNPDDECFEVFFGEEGDENAKFIILPDCGHIFEVSGLDDSFKSLTGGSITSLPRCPRCELPVSTSLRYHNTVLSVESNIDFIKETMFKETQEMLIKKCSALNSLLTVRASNAISDEISGLLPALKRMLQDANYIRLYPMSELLNIITNLYKEFPPVLWTSCSPLIHFFRCEAFKYFLQSRTSFSLKEDSSNISYLKRLYRQCPLYAMFQLTVPKNLSGKDLDLYSELESKFRTLYGTTCSEDELDSTLGICEIFLYKLRGKYQQSIPVCHYDSSFRRNIADTSTEWNKCKKGHFYETIKASSSAMCPYCNSMNS